MKKIISLFLSGVLGLSVALMPFNAGTVHADDLENSQTYIIFDEEKANEIIERRIEEKLYGGKQTRMDEIVYEYTLKKSEYSPLTDHYEAGNQLPGGVNMQAGGTMEWVDSSTVAATYNFSFSFPIGPTSPVTFSVGFTPGRKLSSGVGSYHPAVPQELHNKRVKLYVAKDYVCNRYEVYTYNKYAGPSTKEFYGYEDAIFEYSIDFEYREVIK